MDPKELRRAFSLLPTNLDSLPPDELKEAQDPKSDTLVVSVCKLCKLNGILKPVLTYCNVCHDFLCQDHLSWSSYRGTPLCHVCGMPPEELARKLSLHKKRKLILDLCNLTTKIEKASSSK